jgi:hypothetical protein
MFDDYAAPRRPPGALFRLPGYLHPPARLARWTSAPTRRANSASGSKRSSAVATSREGHRPPGRAEGQRQPIGLGTLDTAAGRWAFRSVFERNDPYGDAEKQQGKCRYPIRIKRHDISPSRPVPGAKMA